MLKEFNSHSIFLLRKYGRRDVMWKQSIKNFDLRSVHWHTQARLIDWTHIYIYIYRIGGRLHTMVKGIHHSKKGCGELKLGLPY